MTRGARQNQGFSAVRRSLSSETMRRTTAGLVFFLVCMQTGISTAKLAPKAFPSSSAFLSTTTTQVATPFATTHVSRLNPRKVAYERIWSFSRGGAEESDADSEEGEEEGADETDEENEEESEAESEGEESEPEDEEIDEVQIEMSVEKYDEPLVASPMLNLYASLAVMMLARKVDLFSPKLVKIARFVYIIYLIALEAFVIYARMKAKQADDRTPVTMTNPLSSVLQSQLGPDGGGNGMVKNLASSFLSTKSTIMEYDLKQAKSMQSGMIVNMMFMWFLHFKMEQVQPLLIQALTGLVNLIYSPLFQVYVLGRNLERPFKNPAMKKLEEAAEKASEQASTNEEEDDEVVSIEEVATTEESESDSEDEDESAAEGEEEVVEKETEQIDEASDEVSVQSDKQPAEEESDDAAEEDSEDA